MKKSAQEIVRRTRGRDTVIEQAGQGTDTVKTDLTYTLGSNLENLTLTGTNAVDGTGNELNNVLTGNGANNTLSGLAGNDTLDGGLGAWGEAANDGMWRMAS